MTDIKFLIIFAGTLLLIPVDSQASIQSRTGCSGKCTIYYNTESHDMLIEKNPAVSANEEVILEGGAISAAWDKFPNGINNLTIGEGITGAEHWAIHPYWPAGVGNANSTITFPSTFKSSVDAGIDYFGSFGTVDMSAMENTSILYNTTQKLVLNPNSGLSVTYDRPNALNVFCKGKESDCRNMITVNVNYAYRYITTNPPITISPYVGLNKDGNWEVWSDEGQMIYEDSSMQKPLAKYDFDGNQTGLYQYDAGGNLVKAVENGNVIYRRRIYTPAEATAAVQNNKNTFSIIYR